MPFIEPLNPERIQQLAALIQDPEIRAKLLMIAASLRPSLPGGRPSKG